MQFHFSLMKTILNKGCILTFLFLHHYHSKLENSTKLRTETDIPALGREQSCCGFTVTSFKAFVYISKVNQAQKELAFPISRGSQSAVWLSDCHKNQLISLCDFSKRLLAGLAAIIKISLSFFLCLKKHKTCPE